MRPIYLFQILLHIHPDTYGVSYIHPSLGKDTWWKYRVGEGLRAIYG